ncbi:MAG: cell wall-binding repeat-containing protein, partial [Tissierellia bacterium]|nr:cell wall-binding repeat-containing protein [Tissierellia bacterium]
YETAVKMAERLFPNGLQVKDNYKNVVIASGDSYPDALTATTTAYNYNAPLLLTQKGQLPKDTAEYLKKVNPSRIVIVGGTQTINEAVEKELEAFGKIKRISGLNRYGTSVENAKDLLRWIMDNNETKWVHGHFGDKGIVYLASGENFPDALAAASPAAVAGSPLLLTMKNQLPKEVKDFIIANKAKEVRVIGGTGSVSDAVIRELRDSNLTANRIAGLDRSATSVEIAKEFYPNANHVFVTSGAGYADALTGATLAAKEGSPVLLLPNADTVSDAVKAYLETYDVTSFTILGGTGTVSEKARTEINNIILGR